MFKTTTLSKLNIAYAIKFLALLTLATVAPLIGLHSQWITGPIVNAALILAVFIVGIRGALLIGILPSSIALSSGLLPPILAPMIPFIIISNTLLILTIDWFKNRIPNPELQVANYGMAVFSAAALKYLFLFLTSGVVINLLLKQSLAVKVAQMMSWPQFFTAIIGGVLAFGLLKMLGLLKELESK